MAPAGYASITSLPARGLIGFRTEFLTETRGTGIMNQRVRGLRNRGRVKIKTRQKRFVDFGPHRHSTPFAILNLQERGIMFIAPGTDVYEGMVVGEMLVQTTWTSNIRQRKEAQQHPYTKVRMTPCVLHLRVYCR